MVKKLIKKTGKNIPLCVFEHCFKKREIPFITPAHIQVLKPRIRKIYLKIEKQIISQTYIYYVDLKPLEARDTLLCTLLREYLNDPSFDNFYKLLENANDILASTTKPKEVAKVTHYFYKNIIDKIPEEDINSVLN